jgi:uncharacterized protein
MFELPIFPLNTVLFPGMPLRLHIFEDRYKQMMKRVMETNHTFGVCLIKNGQEASGPLADPYPVGCTARVIQAEPLEDGKINLTVVGDERFHILRVGNPLPYLSAFVESLPLKSHHSLDVVRGTHVLRRRVTSYLALLARITENEDEAEALDLNFDLTDLQLPEDPMMLIYLSAALLQVPPSEKQPMLEADTAALLLQHVQRLYRREIAVLPALMDVTEDQARGSAWAN